ncbi:amino acid ABC transporter substrate-binding protein [bacterium endosymbiont of Bathymodiolus sp. 5 South]|jgi:general L-amino acid transport system substrate-binding protein|uniref:amino acid ABC transporter substrate-binding protein n=1 Tax=bacterium endosymbiont of Bathymodiolus sp. 5 South TaxID=1181670 RepID=UPI0010BB08B5|nr:amino acid ABC transporter substrate-binding protein [bacterium endosymbiont of Bathymodiolus sp. 5 South]CAC9440219.1 L-amino acid ABC transporter (Glu/Asp/His/...), substrate-binding protein AapJ [uncultured Gammaproteobacteria bacterium]CAC9658982.1 L-amino acid ABC transporter (Glu/Asp/His/...), substrate-binding protein AapJ [uncultured Gammaproteobacteria bacterium]SHN89852.1 Glutamate Aspartate periplasmic binding protein precursor GltI (TC 3.A.1.3.4) [bacterium endosymbiont of Bathymo
MNTTSKNIFLSLLALTGGLYAQADTLSDVQAKGSLSCGVSSGLVGFSSTDSAGRWKGLDVDICRAVAAATLGDANKVKFVPLTAKERFTALQSGEIDLLSRNTTWTTTRDTSLGFNFAGVNYYDGQGFMVKKSLGVTSAKELNGATFCLQAGTTTELTLADYFVSNGMSYHSSPSDTSAQSKKGFSTGRCDALTSDQSQLYALKTTLKDPSSAIILKDIISKEPLGPVVRQGDDKWFNIVKWSLNAMIGAEEFGINSNNVNAKFKNPEALRLLGRSGNLHKHLGLSKKWAFNIISQVGNYAQSFDRNVGKDTPLNISRGLNALWRDGGILYSPPFR